MSRKKSKKKSRKTNPQLLKTIHHYAAGIDLGAREHFVAAPPLEDGEPNVERFGTTTPELFRLAQWLKEQHVDTVAMESTGVYWIPVFELLESQGFEVLLVNARHIRNVPGRKTDMLDCQWIQMLHTCGLLKGSFRPSDDICQLRSLLRERNTMVAQRSDWVRRMQKGLDQMNICVHHAVSDITGTTGMAIIRAIVDGERDPRALARLRDRRCRKTEEQIAEDLTGNWRAEHLFNFEQALKMYDQLCTVIEDYDNEILSTIISLQPDDARDKEVPQPISKSKAKNIAKRGQEPLREALYRFAGVDLTSIDGIGVDTAAVLISELGLDYSKFPRESEFVSYLRLAPNLSISAGKKVPNKSKLTTCTRVSTALRMAALTLRNSKTALGGYYRRIATKKGSSVAVFATARKLAELVYRMVRYGQAYVDAGLEAYEARFNQRKINSYTNYLKSQGYEVVPIESEEVVET